MLSKCASRNIQIGTFEEPCDPYHLKLKDATKSYDLALKYAQHQRLRTAIRTDF